VPVRAVRRPHADARRQSAAQRLPVLLAHPERSPQFLQEPAALAALIDAGAYVQLTAGSLRGDFGRTVRRHSLALLDEGLVHVVSSDAHDADQRPPQVLEVVRHVVREAGVPPRTTEFLTEEAPRALLDDAAASTLPGARAAPPPRLDAGVASCSRRRGPSRRRA
jgi:protein-tyrosine phosphatase